MELNRRNFLRISGTGIAGGFALKAMGGQSVAPVINSKVSPEKIIYRTLGKTGIKLPVVSIGAMRAENAALMKAAVEAGVMHFDTAQSYQEGRNEEMLGAFLKDYKREKYSIATKIKPPKPGTTTEEFLAMIDASLKRLQMSYVDILYYHAVDKKETVLNPKLIQLMEEAKKSGKIKFAGVSSHRNMAEVLKAAVDAKTYDVVLTSYNIKMENQPEITDALSIAAKAGIGIVAMKTMAGGFWDKERTRKINTKAALKWALQNENIHTSIPGVTSFEQLQECAEVMCDINLTETEKSELKNDATTAGLFCLGCEQCIPQCPKNVAIPEIMRSYMYAYGYRDLKLSRQVLDGLTENDASCNLCPECTVACRQGFEIKSKVSDIMRIKEVPVEFLV